MGDHIQKRKDKSSNPKYRDNWENTFKKKGESNDDEKNRGPKPGPTGIRRGI
jgi:hypothetical protein